MKSPFILVIALFLAFTAHAQEQSPQATAEQKAAELENSLSRVDSISNNFNQQADSLKNRYDASLASMDDQTAVLNHRIDSLNNLNLPAEKEMHRLDSLVQARQQTVSDFIGKTEALKDKTTAALNNLQLPPEANEPLQKISQQVGSFNIHSDFVKLPALSAKGFSLPDTEGLNVNALGDVTKNIKQPGGLHDIKAPGGNLGEVTEQIQGVQGDVKSITEGNVGDVNQLPESLEEQAAKVDGVGELQKQSGALNEYKDQLDAVKDPAAGKEQAVEKVKEAAVDHFAGKQEQLKAAMEKIAKYKQKYSSVSSLKDLPKRPPNPMKGKPFIERLVPGLSFQYQVKNFYLIDVHPYAGYRLTGRFTTGLGWNQRFAYDKKIHQWSSRSRIFGPRAYVDFTLGKGFIAHLETEAMNTFVPSTLTGTPDTGKREWVWGMMTGLKKEYRIYKNLKGTALIQYNIFNPNYKAPYVDRLNSRIGFEYILKKKKQQSATGR